MFILVRHAVAVNKQRWSGADHLRPLNRRGLQQSEDLVALLAEHGVTRLLSSPALRCRRTLAPTSEMLSMTVESIDALGVNAPVAGLLDLLGSAEVDHAALCTHGEMFAALSRAWRNTWAGESGAPDLANTPKGGSWAVEDYNTPAVSARYLPLAVGQSADLRRGTAPISETV